CLVGAQRCCAPTAECSRGGGPPCCTMLLHEHSGHQCVPRERVGGSGVRRHAGGRGGGGAFQSSEVRGGIPGAGNSVLLARSGTEAGGNRSCGGAAESVCAAGDKIVLC